MVFAAQLGRGGRNKLGNCWLFPAKLPRMQQAHFFQRIRHLLAAIQTNLIRVGAKSERTGQMAVAAAKKDFIKEVVDAD